MIAIVATDLNNGIGNNNQLLCHLPDDLKRFKQLTIGHVVVMGRKTFESIGKPLPNRTNIVLTSSTNFKHPDIIMYNDYEKLLKEIPQKFSDKKIFIIGGGQIYQLFYSYINEIQRTLIHHSFSADAFFPSFEKDFVLVEKTFHPADEKHSYPFEFQVWKRK
ncbi:MAG: dihydrofolate reductase [Bacteroidia bacterium]|nr:MAG: dihydrofolate reductase [Bacteroidia bacterium]